jgi:GTP-binding protein Era
MEKRAGYVAIIGKPNSGKSTLMNAILGQQLSIVTPKPQTTRNKIFGIYTDATVQIVFIDTPGILRPKYKLQQFMKKELESSFVEADVILLLLDVSIYDRNELNDLYEQYEKDFSKHKVFCVLNKIDLISKERLLQIIDHVSKSELAPDEIVPVSALSGFNMDELVKTIIKYLPRNEFYFGAEIVATQSERFFVTEIIRKNALKLYGEEIPYSVYVEIEEFKENEFGKDLIRAAIIVEKDSQKMIIIGSGGRMIKKLGEHSRTEIEEFLERRVYLELHVKVRKNWKNNEKFLKRKFYDVNV